jgi:hypothetical protein
VDPATSDIRAVEFTPGSDGDSPVLPELLNQIPEGEEIGTETADSAYDIRRCHTAKIDRQAIAIIPIRKNGQPRKTTVRPRLPDTKPCMPPVTMAGHCGSAGPDTIS